MRPMPKINPMLIINPLVYRKMRTLIDSQNSEVAWHGFVKRSAEDVYYWYDITVYPQYVTGVTVNPNEEEYAKWMMKQFELENFDDLKLHGHSHVNMGCSPSAVDMQLREDILKNLPKDSFYIFIIANKKESFTIELYDNKNQIIFDEKDIEVIIGQENELFESFQWYKEQEKEIKHQCLTQPNTKNFSTRAPYKRSKSTSLDAELSEQEFPNYSRDWESDDYFYGTRM